MNWNVYNLIIKISFTWYKNEYHWSFYFLKRGEKEKEINKQMLGSIKPVTSYNIDRY